MALVPGFVLGFLAMVAVNSVITVPDQLVGVAKITQKILLTMAMAALGCDLNLRVWG